MSRTASPTPAAVATLPPPAKRISAATRRKLGVGLLFISPWIFGFLAFGLYPIVMAVYYSFTDYDVLRDAVWVGGLNYADMAADDLFWKSLWNTMVYAAFSVPLGLTLAFLIAVFLHAPIFGRSFFRTFYYVPAIVPLVAVGMIWLWVFNGESGLLNYGLSLIGIEGPQWLADAAWTKPTLILSSIWQIGGAMVLFLAGLQDVPPSLYETIGSVQEFVKPFVMLPGGGENRSALLFAVYIYENAFLYNNMGYACAMAVVLFFIVLFLTWLATKAMGRHVYYGGD